MTTATGTKGTKGAKGTKNTKENTMTTTTMKAEKAARRNAYHEKRAEAMLAMLKRDDVHELVSAVTTAVQGMERKLALGELQYALKHASQLSAYFGHTAVKEKSGRGRRNIERPQVPATVQMGDVISIDITSGKKKGEQVTGRFARVRKNGAAEVLEVKTNKYYSGWFASIER